MRRSDRLRRSNNRRSGIDRHNSVIRFMFVLIMLQWVIAGSVVAAEPVFLERPLGFHTLPDGAVIMADGGGANWSDEGSQILRMSPDGTLGRINAQGLVFAHSVDMAGPGRYLIADTGNNRVIIINSDTNVIEWTTDDFPQISLQYPNNAQYLGNGSILITDRNNNRFIEVADDGRITFSREGLTRPHGAEKLPDGTYLVSDSEADRVLRLAADGTAVWEYGGTGGTQLNWPRDIDLLGNGNYLVTDSRNHRIIELTPSKEAVWEYANGLYWPYAAERLPDGSTRISDSQQKRLIDVSPEGTILRTIENRSPPFILDRLEHETFKGTMIGDRPENWFPGSLHVGNTVQLSIQDDGFRDDRALGIVRQDDDPDPVFWFTRVRVSPDTRYRLSGRLKTDGQAALRLETAWENELGGYNGDPVFSESVTQDEWTEAVVDLVSPSSHPILAIRIRQSGRGQTSADDIILSRCRFVDGISWPHLLSGMIGAGIVGILISRRIWV